MKKKSTRRPPAFQFYATDTLANQQFTLMSAAERGVYLSMRAACWIAGEIPSDPALLARVIGLPVQEVSAALSPVVLAQFQAIPERRMLRDQELDEQMAELIDNRKRQSEGGREGAMITNIKRSAGIVKQ